MDSTSRLLTKEEQNMLQFYRDLASAICYRYIQKGENLSSENLDSVFTLWLKDNAEFVKTDYDIDYHKESVRKPSATMIRLALGTAFGDILNRSYGSDWVHMWGQETAIHHKNSNYTTYPYSSIQKRISSGETGFFSSIEAVMKLQVDKKD